MNYILPATRVGGWLRRHLEPFIYWMPYWPDPDARCPAHGRRYCRACHRNPADCANGDGSCGYWSATGMHWDTCPNRILPDSASANW